MIYRFLSILFFITIIAGCTPKKYEDVTDLAPFTQLLGRVFEIRSKVLAIGVTFDQNYKKQIDYVYLESPPGFSGPEVIFKDDIDIGAKVKVINIIVNRGIIDTYYCLVEFVDGRYNESDIVIPLTGNIDFSLNALVFVPLE